MEICQVPLMKMIMKKVSNVINLQVISYRKTVCGLW